MQASAQSAQSAKPVKQAGITGTVSKQAPSRGHNQPVQSSAPPVSSFSPLCCMPAQSRPGFYEDFCLKLDEFIHEEIAQRKEDFTSVIQAAVLRDPNFGVRFHNTHEFLHEINTSKNIQGFSGDTSRVVPRVPRSFTVDSAFEMVESLEILQGAWNGGKS